MATFFKDGIISKDGKNMGVNVPPTGTNAPGQNPFTGSIPTSINGFVGQVRDIGQQLFSGGLGSSLNFMSALRSKNIPTPTLGNATGNLGGQASFTTGGNVEEKDWRVSLSLPNTPSAFSKSPMFQLLRSTKNSMVFPFTPTILLQHSANYSNVEPVHTNYPAYAYRNSSVNEIVVTGQFYVQNELEAQYWMACLHYLRSVTKMDYGTFAETGGPPPIVKLNGYGDYVFNNVPVVITTFSVDMPPEVDYIATGLKGQSLSAAQEISWAPAESQFSVSCQPIYSRQKQTQFNYNMFVGGHDIGRGYI